MLVLADDRARRSRVAKEDVEKRRRAPVRRCRRTSTTAIKEADFHHLMAYLLEQRVKDK